MDVLNTKEKETLVEMRDKEGPDDRYHLQILDSYRKYKRNFRNITTFNSMFQNLTQVSGYPERYPLSHLFRIKAGHLKQI